MSDAEKKKHAVEILRYAFVTLLKWTPEICVKAINKEILETMKLTNLFRYLQMPEEYNGEIDPRFFANLIFPDKVSFDRDQLVINIYKDVLSERLVECGGVVRKKGYPKKFFQDENGYQRATICMNYALKSDQFKDLEDVYSRLSDPSRKFIKDHKLSLAECNFETPIDFLHESLSEEQQDDFFFAYYKYRYLFNSRRGRDTDVSDNKPELNDTYISDSQL
jgi:hypothetical protein